MDLAAVMDEIAEQLRRKMPEDSRRIFDFPPDKIDSPALIVSWPEEGQYHSTSQRGKDEMTLAVVAAVGKPYDRLTKDLLGKYCNGSGDYSVRQALESPDAVYTAFDKESLVVEWPEFDVIAIAGIDYMAAVFSVRVSGKGD